MAEEFIDLFSVLNNGELDKFSFADYYEHERTIIKPALEAKGYTNVCFAMGERDSFGPLSRIVYALSEGKKHVRFIYG